MSTMLDLPAALRAAGLTVWVAPDWRTNGHGIDLITPFGGLWHHTAGYGLHAVYGLPDARPDVPQPRCNLWTPRPGTKPYDIAVCTAGRAWHAGTGRAAAYADLRAGRFTARTPDALARFGRDSDDVDAGWTSAHTVGNEVEHLGTTAAPVPPRQVQVVEISSAVCVELFGWPGPGCWANHRQMTFRKPDWVYRGNLWAGTAAALDTIRNGGDDMAQVPQAQWDEAYRWIKATGPVLATLIDKVNRTGGAVAQARAELGDDEAHLLAAIAALAAPTPTGVRYVQQVGRAEVYEVISGRARHVSAEEWAVLIGGHPDLIKRLDPAKPRDAALLGQLGIPPAVAPTTEGI